MKLTANPALGFFHVWVGGSGAKLVRVMKLTTIIILAACLHTTANGIAQNTITFSGKDVNLESVFSAIKKQTSYRFFFNTSIIQNASKITLEVRNAPIEQVMNLALKDQSLTFAIKGRTIFVMKKQEEEKKTSFNEQPLNPIDVKGRVVNENGEPVESVTVTVKGTQYSTSTNSNGEFAMKTIDDNATLVFTSVNMETFEVKVKGKLFVDVTLQAKVTAMQEVVINKGYYTEKAKLATGNVSTVKSKDIQNQPVQNPLLALVGKVAGVTIEQQTGFANSAVVVRIQGRNSINSGLDPLYVIDGVPYISQNLPTIGLAQNILGNTGGTSSTGGGNPLSFIDPGNIESIDVLKDADATAIYGSRGANGVILITTKKGKAGKTTVTANYRSGWGRVSNKVQLLNTEQYLLMRKEAFLNDGLPVPTSTTAPNNSNYDLTFWDSTRYTDWQKELIGGTAKYTDARINISGGSSNTQFSLSSAYHKETTVFPDNFADKKVSFGYNINHVSNNQKFKLQTSAIYTIYDNQLPANDLTALAMKLAPNAPALYNSDHSLNWAPIPQGAGTVSTWLNPLADYLLSRYDNKVNNLIGSLLLSYQLLPDLSVTTRMGYTNLQSDQFNTSPLTAVRPERRSTTNRGASYGTGINSSWIVEPQLTYKIKILNGRFEALLGSSFQENRSKSNSVSGTGYSSDLQLQNISAAASITTPSPSSFSLYKYNAIFGRINYNYNDRYIINLTGRRDGSSRFGSENLFNNFWGVAGSWIFSNEDWFSKNADFINFGKVRISYGTTGNDQIGDYGFMNLYKPVSNVTTAYQGISAMSPSGHSNPYLQWEETKKLQFGLDLGLLKDRFVFNVNYYLNRSSNLLVQSGLSVITGFGKVLENFNGLVENKGWEFTLSSANFRNNNFSWITNVNFTVPIRNGQLLSFPNFANTIYANTYSVGKSLYDVKANKFLEVDPMTGLYLFVDDKGNSISVPATKDKIGFYNVSQRFFGGVQNNIRLKSFELDFTFQFVKKDAPVFGGQTTLGNYSGTGNSGNQPEWVLKRWQNIYDVTNIQRFTTAIVGPSWTSFSNYRLSDAAYTDANFIRLTNVSLSWTLPRLLMKQIHFQGGQVFIQGQNLLTVTNYKGLDPSTGSSMTLPPLRVMTLGAQLSF